MNRRDVLLDALATAIENRSDAELASLLDPSTDAEHCEGYEVDLTLPAALSKAAPADVITAMVAPRIGRADERPTLETQLLAQRLGRSVGPVVLEPLAADWEELGRWCSKACSLAAPDATPEILELVLARSVDLWRATTLALMEPNLERAGRLLRWLTFAPEATPGLFASALKTFECAPVRALFHARVAAALRPQS